MVRVYYLDMDNKILSIVDSREKVEVPDGRGDTRIVGVPGTGNRRPCDTCGKLHEIHVTVDTGNGLRVVGLGCAKKDQNCHTALLLHEIVELVRDLGIQAVSVPGDFVSRLVANPKFQLSAEYYLDGANSMDFRWDRLNRAQKSIVNKISNRGQKIRQSLQRKES